MVDNHSVALRSKAIRFVLSQLLWALLLLVGTELGDRAWLALWLLGAVFVLASSTAGLLGTAILKHLLVEVLAVVRLGGVVWIHHVWHWWMMSHWHLHWVVVWVWWVGWHHWVLWLAYVLEWSLILVLSLLGSILWGLHADCVVLLVTLNLHFSGFLVLESLKSLHWVGLLEHVLHEVSVVPLVHFSAKIDSDIEALLGLLLVGSTHVCILHTLLWDSIKS